MTVKGASARHRHWPGFLNARTLAGVPTHDGHIGEGRLYRSDEPLGPVAATTEALAGEGIRTVLDLRSAHETDKRPSILAGEALYIVSPLVDPRMDRLRDPASENDLLDLYRGSVDRNGRTISESILRIVHAPAGGVLVHCAAGKDRTGILVAVLLDALGTPEADIIDDYVHTEGRLAPYFARELAAIDDPARRERLASRQHATAETMSGLLDHLRRVHGGGAEYLHRHGLSKLDLRLLARRLTA